MDYTPDGSFRKIYLSFCTGSSRMKFPPKGFGVNSFMWIAFIMPVYCRQVFHKKEPVSWASSFPFTCFQVLIYLVTIYLVTKINFIISNNHPEPHPTLPDSISNCLTWSLNPDWFRRFSRGMCIR